MSGIQGKFVLLDFDGVIADSFKILSALHIMYYPDRTEEDYRDLFLGNIYQSSDELRARKAPLPIGDWFEMYVPKLLTEVQMFPGIDESLKILASSHKLAIISSMTEDPMRAFLEQRGLLSLFADILGLEADRSKVRKVDMLLQKYETTAEHCVYITDTLGDMHEMKEHEMGVIACSWGFHDHKTLQRGIPFRIVDSPLELPDAVDDYFSQDTI